MKTRCGKLTYYDNWTSTVETSTVRILPDIFNIIRVAPDESVSKLVEDAFNSLGVSFKSCFTPPYLIVGSLNTNEKPPGRNPKGLSK